MLTHEHAAVFFEKTLLLCKVVYYSSARNCLACSRERDSFSSEFWRRELYGSSLDFSVLTAKWQQDDPQKLICSTHEVKVGLPGMPCLIKAVSRGRCCERCQELAKTGVGHVETVSGSSHQTYLRNK